jgi:hypothetical protein
MNASKTNKENRFKNIPDLGVAELSQNELQDTNGGEPITGAAAVAVAVGGGLAVFVAGAVVAYGTYKALEWAFE